MYVSWRQGDVGHEASSASAGWVVDYLLGRELAGARPACGSFRSAYIHAVWC
jgi:hypothetical protein